MSGPQGVFPGARARILRRDSRVVRGPSQPASSATQRGAWPIVGIAGSARRFVVRRRCSSFNASISSSLSSIEAGSSGFFRERYLSRSMRVATAARTVANVTMARSLWGRASLAIPRADWSEAVRSARVRQRQRRAVDRDVDERLAAVSPRRRIEHAARDLLWIDLVALEEVIRAFAIRRAIEHDRDLTRGRVAAPITIESPSAVAPSSSRAHATKPRSVLMAPRTRAFRSQCLPTRADGYSPPPAGVRRQVASHAPPTSAPFFERRCAIANAPARLRSKMRLSKTPNARTPSYLRSSSRARRASTANA